MSRFDRGWIKLYRSLLDSDISGRGNFTLGALARIFLMANRKDSEVVFNGKLVKLKPGQLITGLRELSPDVDEDPYLHRIRNALLFLETRCTITQAASNQGRLITVCNWEQYHSIEIVESNVTASEAQAERKQGASRAQLSGEGEKGRKGEEDSGEGLAPPKPLALGFDDAKLQSIFAEREVKQHHWDAWIAAYPDAQWIAQEVKRAVVWELSNPANKKKRFAAFVSRWLAKDWDTRNRGQSNLSSRTPYNGSQGTQRLDLDKLDQMRKQMGLVK